MRESSEFASRFTFNEETSFTPAGWRAGWPCTRARERERVHPVGSAARRARLVRTHASAVWPLSRISVKFGWGRRSRVDEPAAAAGKESPPRVPLNSGDGARLFYRGFDPPLLHRANKSVWGSWNTEVEQMNAFGGFQKGERFSLRSLRFALWSKILRSPRFPVSLIWARVTTSSLYLKD